MSLIDLSILDQSAPSPKAEKNLFEEKDKRKAWEKEKLARCDFVKQVKILHRAGFYFISVWNKSVKGRTLVDIKAVRKRSFCSNIARYAALTKE